VRERARACACVCVCHEARGRVLVSDGRRGSVEPPPCATLDSEAMLLLYQHDLRAAPPAVVAQPPPSPPKSPGKRLSRCPPLSHAFTDTAVHPPPSPARSLARGLPEKELLVGACAHARRAGA
jgi:hypothetical protein